MPKREKNCLRAEVYKRVNSLRCANKLNPGEKLELDHLIMELVRDSEFKTQRDELLSAIKKVRPYLKELDAWDLARNAEKILSAVVRKCEQEIE